MHLKFWVTCMTDEKGEGRAYINMVSNLRIAQPPAENTVIHSGTFLISEAGSKKNWDVGLCSLKYKSDIQEQEAPEIGDYFFNEKNDWFDGEKSAYKMAEELHDCRVTFKNVETGIPATKNCLDVNQGGQSDWHISELSKKRWQFRKFAGKKEVNYDCPARRELNSLDYKDQKVNMLKAYQVWGFYHMTKPDADLSKIGADKIEMTQAGYTVSEGVKIDI